MNELINTFGLDWRLLLIQIVNFGILLFVLKRYLYGPVMNMLDERKRFIEQGIKDAEDAAQKNKMAEAEGRSLVAEATREGDSIIAKAQVRAEEKGATILTAAEEKAALLARDADMRAAEMKDKAMRESREEIAKAALLVAEKILRGETAKKI
ncbi:MAG: F0F1-type synthase subunit b, F-type H+-transporting ATPase subunit b [Candidatus Parcubacteria bacterium]|jgi:F-type H+-transporting ATPase subunit b